MYMFVRGEDFRHALIEALGLIKDRAFAVHVYDQAEYEGMLCVLSDDHQTGFALKGTEIVSVFSTVKGRGSELMALAIAWGGRKLDCFDCGLVDFYIKCGFEETGRMAWDDAYAPEGWDYEAHGRPDVVFMDVAQADTKEAA